MLRQILTKSDKESIKEFRLALASGELEPVLAPHSDETLLWLLRNRHDHWRTILYVLGIAVFLILVTAIGTWLTGTLIIAGSGFTLTLANRSEGRRNSAKAWATIGKRVEAASLPVLLEAYQLNIRELTPAIRTGMIKQLTLATHEDLLRLNSWHRQLLVNFTLGQLRSFWGAYQNLNSAQRQAATLGYLALATLKQRGAEHPDRRNINANHANLKHAISEYLAALQNK